MLQHLELTESAALSGCAQPNICAYLEGGGAASIGANASGCNSAAEVLAACTVGTHDADGTSADAGFQVFPNPLPEGEALRIVLENDFTGAVKFEVLSLDGRALETFYAEKRERVMTLYHLPAPVATTFFLRASDNRRSATRLILRF